MPIQIQRELAIVVSNDTAQAQVLHRRRAALTDAASNTVASDGTRLVGAGATVRLDQAGLSTVRVVMIETDAAVHVHFAELGEKIAVSPRAAGQRGLLYLEGELAGVWVTNPSSTAAATITFVVLG